MQAPSDDLARLEAHIRHSIPLTRAIGLRLYAYAPGRLIVRAPLAPNINDKGCAFGGSLASVMTLAGWALINLHLAATKPHCDVFVGRSEVAYRVPVWHDFEVVAELAEGADWDRFDAALAGHGKARIDLACHSREVGSDGVCATLHARFVARQADVGTAARHQAQ